MSEDVKNVFEKLKSEKILHKKDVIAIYKLSEISKGSLVGKENIPYFKDFNEKEIKLGLKGVTNLPLNLESTLAVDAKLHGVEFSLKGGVLNIFPGSRNWFAEPHDSNSKEEQKAYETYLSKIRKIMKGIGYEECGECLE